MNNKKCPNCGFINFLTAEVCHKCSTDLSEAEGSVGATYSGSYAPAGYPYHGTAAKSGGFPIVKAGLCLFAGLILLAVGAGVLANMVPREPAIAWREFRSPHASLSVMMPTEPKVNEPVVTALPQGNMENHVYSSMVMGQGSALYCVVSFPTKLPTGQAALEKLLEDELDHSLKVTNATLVSKKSIDVGGNPGLEFELKPPSLSDLKSPHGFGKVFIMDNQEYFLMITASEGSDLLKDRDLFLNPTPN